MEHLTSAIGWVGDHWVQLVAGKLALDFVVKASPWKGDDVVLDVFWKALKAVAGKSDQPSDPPK